MSREKLVTPEVVKVELDQPRIDIALAASRNDAQSEQQRIINEVLELGCDVGALRTFRLMKGVSAVGEIQTFVRVNKSKAFKHIAIPHPDGSFCPAENIDDFCHAVFGKGYKAMSNQKEMLDKLGEETFEAATSLGLNRSQLRLLINLPEDTRSAVEEAMQAGSKSDVVTLIQSLANQLDKSNEKTEELKAEVAAKEEVLTRRAKQVDALEEKLSRAKKLPPDEVLAELHRESTAMLNDTRGALIGKFSACVEAIDAHHAAHGGDSAVFLAGLCGQLQADLNALRDRFGIPDVAPAMIPEWVNDPAFQALTKD